ncbi:DUF2249 domain-containing protein [Bdellovibrio svalbardensis]|uniref:DUF2249 domain-containing protein n=1 Tax=Bdellovibrio svalbardensis TaxID=2972972 RepID=A0ABT6DLW2_9BACT|nr:DUF2249 domain-containing protein [Bdellovibrio svalbardensis]MDG0816904.1 DUF2249 domain-containing protein [Bdellovibrio svalbardensis]
MTEFVIEVQKMEPQHRHAFIFQQFDNLQGGESILIVNNHDPLPLLRQFRETRPEQFVDEYLQKGPTEWRLRLTKKKKEGCCGFCGES